MYLHKIFLKNNIILLFYRFMLNFTNPKWNMKNLLIYKNYLFIYY